MVPARDTTPCLAVPTHEPVPQPLMAASSQAGSAPAAAGGASSRPKSKAYMSTVAIQSDAAKYRQKYKELKRKVHEIEQVCASRPLRN